MNDSLPKWDLPWGWFGPYNNNELAIVSEVEDPPMMWFASKHGGSLGSLTFGRQRPDGRLEAMILIQGKQDERTKGASGNASLTGELTVHIRNGAAAPGNDDAQFIKVLELRHDGCWIIGMDGHAPSFPVPNHPAVDPVEPTAPPAPEPVDTSLHFNYRGSNYDVHAGDFATMEYIFKVKLDASDVRSYHDGNLSWQEVYEKFLRKVANDDVSR
jgi:hypothetical protein